MRVDLFVYGTLLDDALVERLAGRCFPKHTAQLAGYRKFTPAGEYPYIVADDDSTVEGALLCGVDSDALQAFDLYEDEGHLYRRVEVTVSLAGKPRCAFAYVAARRCHTRGRTP